jgi:alpha-tubulin suppressor-like RCC1 family protein
MVSKSRPVQVGTGTNWQAVAAGWVHTVALKSDRTLWAWGSNLYAQLGDGTGVNKSSPAQVGTGTNWQAVAAGWVHTVALESDGTLWAWGGNYDGRLGDGTTAHKSSPVQVGTVSNWQAVAAGWCDTVALQRDGTLWASGLNNFGQLGDGTTAKKSSLVQVGTGINWQAVAAGYGHTVALQRDGTLWAWGRNNVGQLGDGQITPGKIGLPAIVTQPEGQSAPAGARVCLRVAATGSKPLSYQWQHNGINLTDNARLNGSQYASLTLFSLHAGDAGNYLVIVTNSYGSVTSAVAVLRVARPIY